MSDLYRVSRDDWSLHRKGEIDRQRHREKVKEAIKKNLADVVSEESIMSNVGHTEKPLRT
jgi:hypothetical protein